MYNANNYIYSQHAVLQIFSMRSLHGAFWEAPNSPIGRVRYSDIIPHIYSDHHISFITTVASIIKTSNQHDVRMELLYVATATGRKCPDNGCFIRIVLTMCRFVGHTIKNVCNRNDMLVVICSIPDILMFNWVAEKNSARKYSRVSISWCCRLNIHQCVYCLKIARETEKRSTKRERQKCKSITLRYWRNLDLLVDVCL